jgi:sugar phosphate permease
MTLTPLIQFTIDKVGWRSSLQILACIILGVVVPLTAIFQRRSPREVAQCPNGLVPEYGESPPAEIKRFWENTSWPDPSSKWSSIDAFCTGSFWWLALMNFLVGFVMQMMVVHQAAHVVDAGYSLILAASLLGLVGLLGSTGGILCGLISDCLGREVTYTIGSSAVFVGLWILVFIRDTTCPWMLYMFAILYGLGHGAMSPIYAATTGDLFPGNALGQIMGILSIGFGVGGAIGVYMGGYFYDRMGSYTVPFLLSIFCISLGILGIWIAAPRHKRTPSALGDKSGLNISRPYGADCSQGH